jgi:holliday junction DNA helicase RuvA
MITSIQGLLTEAGPLRAVIELNGLSYEANVPVTTAERLPRTGSVVRLHTVVIYREDSQTLYGFATAEERDFFQLLIDHVKGVGPKVALSIMSRLSLPLLVGAIRSGDTATLAKCPGIGKKIAERLVIELKAKVGGPGAAVSLSPAADGAPLPHTPHADAVAALAALGYKVGEADEAVRRASRALGPEATTEALVKKALA